jgi:hypothetical protein
MDSIAVVGHLQQKEDEQVAAALPTIRLVSRPPMVDDGHAGRVRVDWWAVLGGALLALSALFQLWLISLVVGS